MAREILTVGHSTLAFADFTALLGEREVRLLVDVRAYPGSRRFPHFSRDSLAAELPARGIGYVHERGLGGRRKPRPDSAHAGWENESFRAYADHMESHEFLEALERLESLAREKRTAIMCAEAVWWRCHRRLVSDALLVRGWRVLHVRPNARSDEHALTPFAVVVGGRIEYPSSQSSLDV